MMKTRNQLRQEKTGKLIPKSQNEKPIRKRRNSKTGKGDSPTSSKGQKSQLTRVVEETEKNEETGKEREGVDVEKNYENAPRVETAGGTSTSLDTNKTNNAEGYVGNITTTNNNTIQRQLAHIERQQAHIARQQTGLTRMLRDLVHGRPDAREMSWTRCVHLMHTGDLNGAYKEVIGTGDAFLLVKLMEETGPVIDRLTIEVSDDVMHAVGQLLMEESYFDVALSWLQQVKQARDNNEEALQSNSDRLSDLPDAVLITILSLLNPREAIKTRVLSKRWRNLCTFVPCVVSELVRNLRSVKGNTLDKLISGCPTIEELTLKWCQVEMSSDISFYDVKRLHMSDCDFYNEQGACSDFYISAPGLEYLEYYGANDCAAKFKGLSEVKEAKIHTFKAEDFEVYNCEILSSLSSVENLTIHNGCWHQSMKALLHAELPKCPTFNFLKNLTLGPFCVRCRFGMWGPFLNRCPNLKIITLHHGSFLCEDREFGYNKEDEDENSERICCEQLRCIDIVGSHWDLEETFRIEQLIEQSTIGIQNLQINFRER